MKLRFSKNFSKIPCFFQIYSEFPLFLSTFDLIILAFLPFYQKCQISREAPFLSCVHMSLHDRFHTVYPVIIVPISPAAIIIRGGGHTGAPFIHYYYCY